MLDDNTPADQQDSVSEQQSNEVETDKIEMLDLEPKLEVQEEVTDQDSPEVPAPVVEDDQQAVDKKRIKNAIESVERKNEEVRRMVELQAEIVAENPDLIHKIAATDPNVANQVVKKVWGESGINSYKQLLQKAREATELESIKDTNPDLYQTKLEMQKVTAKLEKAAQKEQERTRKSFFESKKILVNEYDPNYRKVNDALQYINPSIVEEDYEKALELAYTFAFSGTKPIPSTRAEAPSVSTGQPQPANVMPSSKGLSGQSTWLADQLNKTYGYDIKF